MNWNQFNSLTNQIKKKKFEDWCLENQEKIFSNPFDETFEKKNEYTYTCIQKGNVPYSISKNEENQMIKNGIRHDNLSTGKIMEHHCNQNGNRCTFLRFEDIFICKFSRKVHKCTKEECKLKKKFSLDGNYSCLISGYVTVSLIYGFNTHKEEDEGGIDLIPEKKREK